MKELKKNELGMVNGGKDEMEIDIPGLEAIAPFPIVYGEAGKDMMVGAEKQEPGGKNRA